MSTPRDPNRPPVDFYGVFVTQEHMHLGNIGLAERLLLAIIQVHALNKSGTCWAGNQYLAEIMDVQPEEISRRVKRLVDAGYLESDVQPNHDGKGGHIRYLIPTDRCPAMAGKATDRKRQSAPSCANGQEPSCANTQDASTYPLNAQDASTSYANAQEGSCANAQEVLARPGDEGSCANGGYSIPVCENARIKTAAAVQEQGSPPSRPPAPAREPLKTTAAAVLRTDGTDTDKETMCGASPPPTPPTAQDIAYRDMLRARAAKKAAQALLDAGFDNEGDAECYGQHFLADDIARMIAEGKRMKLHNPVGWLRTRMDRTIESRSDARARAGNQ